MKVLGLDFADAAAWMREKLFGERPDMQRPAIALARISQQPRDPGVFVPWEASRAAPLL
jgi:hypothetical protein